MAFELGLFLAAKTFGSGLQKEKIALVLDEEKYRYQKALSDIAGQDIASHQGDPEVAIGEVRNWLDSSRGQSSRSLPGGDYIIQQFRRFANQLPKASRKQNLKVQKLTYADLCRAVEAWLVKTGYAVD